MENQIKEMDADQMKTFFSEKINSIKEEIKCLGNPVKGVEKEKLNELRQYIEIVYIVKKQNRIVTSTKSNKIHNNQNEIISEQKNQKLNKHYEKLRKKES
ncbi:MAG: hypothetical protein IPM47_07450 [Sphingobacteriales bacterium]|nr:MAG: hypothetical protein IPM47_07450 [Sphingobacteriales bacterium]